MFEDFLCSKNDNIDNAAYQLSLALCAKNADADESELEWDMAYIGEIVDAAEAILQCQNIRSCHPFYEGDIPCHLGEDCKNADCPLKTQSTSCPNSQTHNRSLDDRAKEDLEGDTNMKELIDGNKCWVIKRDGEGLALKVIVCMFLAKVSEYVIASRYIDSITDIKGTLEYHTNETSEVYGTDLMVYPAVDVFASRQDADKALEKELKEV